MEKFSGKEKVALVLFGMILLAIILQVVSGNNLFLTGPERITPVEWREADLSGNLLRRPGTALSASSRNAENQTPERLSDGDARTFWHVALDQVGDPAWVTADFGAGESPIVRSLAALPREDLPRQFFQNARILGSNNGEDWETIAAIVLWETPRAVWWKWEFDNSQAFRYYRLLISDGHEGGKFYSMAELALFE